MKHRLGFTVVEIIVVVTAIAILASIGTVTYSGLQARARDEDRIADMHVMASSLETYREQNGYYPSIYDFYAGGLTGTPLPFIQRSNTPRAALTDPGHQSATEPHYSYRSRENAISSLSGGGNASSWPSSDTYTYLSYRSDNGNLCIGGPPTTNCSRYTLFYKDEQGTVQEVRSKFGW